MKVVEEKHDSVLLKLKQKDNEVNALKQVLSRFSSSKQEFNCAMQLLEEKYGFML